MKLSRQQVEERLTVAWGKEAVVVPYRIHGNRRSYAVTDHGSHWMPIETSWVGGRQVFEPVSGDWPEVEQDSWDLALVKAAELARAYFENQGNTLALRRLPRGMVIAEAQNWTRLGDELDTYLIRSQSKGGTVYEVNGRCTCPDWLLNGVPGGWCKHRIARALAIRATEMLKENGAGSAVDTPTPSAGPHRTTTQVQDTTEPDDGQAQRIDLIVAYEASDANSLTYINANGKLVEFKADGLVAPPPTRAMAEVYRWLQANSYVPDCFKWLGWDRGLRHRRQSYVLKGDAPQGWVSRGLSRLLGRVL
ncbi:SWIM zinc finger family protein [Chloroflexota bacterium]